VQRLRYILLYYKNSGLHLIFSVYIHKKLWFSKEFFSMNPSNQLFPLNIYCETYVSEKKLRFGKFSGCKPE